ncbi:MAG: hypothetical protein ABR985_00240 [Methanotrichaceae archaeon]|jgi:hypothetical protein
MLIVIDKTIGIAGRKIYYYDFQGNDNVINAAGMHLNLWIGTHTNEGLFEVDRGQYDIIRMSMLRAHVCWLVRKCWIDLVSWTPDISPIGKRHWRDIWFFVSGKDFRNRPPFLKVVTWPSEVILR